METQESKILKQSTIPYQLLTHMQYKRPLLPFIQRRTLDTWQGLDHQLSFLSVSHTHSPRQTTWAHMFKCLWVLRNYIDTRMNENGENKSVYKFCKIKPLSLKFTRLVLSW